MTQKRIYYGRFISTPKPDELLIRTGAVLVDRTDGGGVIEKAIWSVNGPEDAVSKLGVEAPVITAKETGFFFPGFIGKSQMRDFCPGILAPVTSGGLTRANHQ
jgi:hypothetical protein